ncbi:MAG TPA: S41 family peptidase [Bacteroidales bacterium]|nr:S41 family peptidase [Bacteroidales bacterium]
MRNRKYLLPLLFSIILIAGIIIGNWYGSRFESTGAAIHSFMYKNSGGENNDMTFSLLPRTNKINTVLSYIQNQYVDTVNVEKLTEEAIPAIVDQLDPHSMYIPAKELEKFNEPLVGNFSGIGIQFNMNNDTVAVINTIPNGPSEIVGILPGDRIIKVNDTLVAGVHMPTDSVVSKLRGLKGSTVRVSVLRKKENDLLQFEITRDDIPLHSVDVAYMMDPEIGYIKISTFSQTTAHEFLKAATDLHKQGMKKLILDLRGNGGGVLSAATSVADQFLPQNKLIVYTKGKSKAREDYYSTANGISQDDELIILMDEYSASASEILAGAIQDNDRGEIVGRRSFGKGLVQEQVQFRDGSALRLTIARYYTPTGRCIQKPYTSNREEYYEDIHERFLSGELESADSIKFADSLKYVTPGGKIVYGGGGIMPDVFVPLDTTGISPYFNKVRNLGLIYRFAFNYTDTHRSRLEEMNTANQINDYLNNTNFFNEFVKFAGKNGVKPNWKDIRTSKQIIATQIKAYIARNIIDNQGFYPIIRQIDKTLQKAESLFEKEKS